MMRTIHRTSATLAAAGLLVGCSHFASRRARRSLDAHYVLYKGDESLLDGPFKMEEVVSANTILVTKEGNESTITLRGCLSTGRESLDAKARRLLGTLWPGEVYLRKDSTARGESGILRGVVYDPANRVCIGRDQDGKLRYENLTYTMAQLKLILYGYCILDHSDTDYPLHPVLCEAELLAKKHRRGYWEDH